MNADRIRTIRAQIACGEYPSDEMERVALEEALADCQPPRPSWPRPCSRKEPEIGHEETPAPRYNLGLPRKWCTEDPLESPVIVAFLATLPPAPPGIDQETLLRDMCRLGVRVRSLADIVRGLRRAGLIIHVSHQLWLSWAPTADQFLRVETEYEVQFG